MTLFGLLCKVIGHKWDGPFSDYGDMPAGIRGCRRCGVWNYELCRPVRIVFDGELSEEELDKAFAGTLKHPIIRAFVQLLDTAEDDANRKAAEEPENREMYVGGAARLRLLLDEIAIRHERGQMRRRQQAASEDSDS